MAPKNQLDRAAWQWAETTDPDKVGHTEVQTAYRLTAARCKTSCRRNCVGSPLCLNGLGERDWLQDIEDSAWHDIEDPNTERRQKDMYVGLKNLGATCYINTFLQVWFHNAELRRAMLKWQEPHEALNSSMKPVHEAASLEANTAPHSCTITEAQSNSTAPDNGVSVVEAGQASSAGDDNLAMPATVCGHLQLIFALLQFSKRRYIDISSFIKFLELDAGVQQDAQEFSKLLIALLEDTLSLQPDPHIRHLIQNQFRGSYDYVTRCSSCAGGSERPSHFYELDLNIKGHKDLDGCIQEFLEQEKLEGDNQYYCERCACKQNATRSIQLRSLPQVLNLQLLRFVFDRKTGHKKKLNTYIQFPEVLDMGKYLGKEEGECVYNLTSVLIHRGPSAYSGHYVAHIQDSTSGHWYKFNDEEVQKMAGKNLQLGNEDEIDGSKSVKKPRGVKGCHASRNAYMLVYQRRRDHQPVAMEPLTLASLPCSVQRLVERDHQQFEAWIIEMGKMRDQNVTKGKARQEEIKAIHSRLHPKPEEEYEFLVTKWLSDWYSKEVTKAIDPVDNSSLLCPHKRLHPDSVTKCKCVSAEAAELIYAKYSGGPRLKSDSLCWDCVQERCRLLRTKSKVKEDSKVIADLLKLKDTDVSLLQSSYWVGKASIRSWKRLVNEQIEMQQRIINASASLPSETAESLNTSFSMETESSPLSSTEAPAESTNHKSGVEESSQVASSLVSSSAEAEDTWKFNEDLLCEDHGHLSSDTSCRRLVAEEVWHRFRFYFPECPEFPSSAEPCAECLKADALEQQKLADRRHRAALQKAALADLYADKHRPVWNKTTKELCLLQQYVIDHWKKFIRDPVRVEPLEELGNRTLLCPHGGFLFDPSLIGQTDATLNLTYIWPEEWNALAQFVTPDTEIRISRIEEVDCPVTYLSSPDTCEECSAARYEADYQERMNYTSAVIYVRKMTDETQMLAPPKESPDDPEFIQDNGKRKKTSSSEGEKALKLQNGMSRRSARHRRVRGEKEITVSSTQTLWDLKIQLMKSFSAAPMDQHLIMDGKDIVGDSKATLASLNIPPGAIIYLKVDEPCDDPTFLEDPTKAHHPEEGFKGTGLLRT